MVGSGAGRWLMLNESAIAVTIEVTVSTFPDGACGWTYTGWVISCCTGSRWMSWGSSVGCTVEFRVSVSDTERLGYWGGGKDATPVSGRSSTEATSSSSSSASWYTFSFALAIAICFFASICSNSNFLCANSASILAVVSCFASSCRALNSASFAASSAAATTFFTSMRDDTFEDRLILDRRDLVDAVLLDLLRSDSLSSSLHDAPLLLPMYFPSSVYVIASHASTLWRISWAGARSFRILSYIFRVLSRRSFKRRIASIVPFHLRRWQLFGHSRGEPFPFTNYGLAMVDSISVACVFQASYDSQNVLTSWSLSFACSFWRCSW